MCVLTGAECILKTGKKPAPQGSVAGRETAIDAVREINDSNSLCENIKVQFVLTETPLKHE
jgi:hypothetical protein